MSILSRKVDAIARCVLATNVYERNAAVKELQALMAQKTESAADLELVIQKMLFDLGVPDHILGHRYLVTALTIAVQDPNAIVYITNSLYPAVAEKHDTTGSRVERAIRHAIEVGFSRMDCDVMARCFGNTINALKDRPTNSEFIARIANEIKRQMKEGS